MKNRFIFILALISMCSCSSEFMPENGPSQPSNTFTKGLSSNEPSISNPNLHSNWEDVSTINLNGGGEIDAPWATSEGSSNSIPESYRNDIKKKDGWLLLSHTMLNSNSKEPNYLLFYNKNRGIFKGFYFNPNPMLNMSLMWVLESLTPTSILPSNNILSSIMNDKYSYSTTSNIINSSEFNFGELVYGWNCFSFELPYGTINNNPTINIKAYNKISSSITLEGNYTGEVIIPITANNPSILGSINSIISKVTPYIPLPTVVSKAIKIATMIIGNTSLSQTTTTSTLRATSAGKINLDGTSFSQFGGAVPNLNNILLKQLNNNTDIGLWAISEKPEFACNKYSQGEHISGNMFSGGPNGYTFINKNTSLKINPAILQNIRKYTVNASLYLQNPQKGVVTFRTDKLTDNCFDLNNLYFDFTLLRYPSDIDECIIFTEFPINYRFEFFTNITITFEYHDGSTFTSSRNYPATLNTINNIDDVNYWNQLGVKTAILKP